jgi:hypothetical protein
MVTEWRLERPSESRLRNLPHPARRNISANASDPPRCPRAPRFLIRFIREAELKKNYTKNFRLGPLVGISWNSPITSYPPGEVEKCVCGEWEEIRFVFVGGVRGRADVWEHKKKTLARDPLIADAHNFLNECAIFNSLNHECCHIGA